MKDMAIAWVLTLPAAALIALFLVKFAAFTHPVVAYVFSAASVAGNACDHEAADEFCRPLPLIVQHHNRVTGLLVWAKLVMANAKGRHEVEASVQEQNAAQELAEMPDVRLLAEAERSEDETGAA
jgi:hypothetical protein